MIPYRAKNPPERIPYVTYGLMGLNTLIFLATSQYGLILREGVMMDWAVSHNTMNPLRILSAMFLHANILHLLGNMLALWIFGCAVEGRLGPGLYLAAYIGSGIVGSLLHDGVIGYMRPEQFGLGASGAIMGMAGAYLYLFPFARICIFWGPSWWRYMRGLGWTSEWHAQWVVLYYVGFDLFDGIMSKSLGVSGGVANFAHLGGFAAGFLLMLALRQRRDTEEASDAQAMRADGGGDIDHLALPELEALVGREPDNARIVETFVRKAILRPEGGARDIATRMFAEKLPLLLAQGDPDTVGRLALNLSLDSDRISAGHLLRAAGRAESVGSYDLADDLFARVLELYPTSPDAEMALSRRARLCEQAGDKVGAASFYITLLQRFPHSPQTAYANAALSRLGFTAGSVAPAPMPTASSARPANPAPSAPTPASPTSMPTLAAPAPPAAEAPEPTHGLAPIAARSAPPAPAAAPSPLDDGRSAADNGLRPIGS